MHEAHAWLYVCQVTHATARLLTGTRENLRKYSWQLLPSELESSCNRLWLVATTVSDAHFVFVACFLHDNGAEQACTWSQINNMHIPEQQNWALFS